MPNSLRVLDAQRLEALNLPHWLVEKLQDPKNAWLDRAWAHDERMQLAVDLSKWSIDYGTGGPFGASVFSQDTGQLISVGVNAVVPSCDATAHAEVVAMRMGGQRLARFNLSGTVMYSSAQPCSMCLGAILWSGIQSVFFAANKDQVESIGFDEGPATTPSALKKRGVVLKHMPGPDHLFEKAATQVLKSYCQQGGLIYNGRGD